MQTEIYKEALGLYQLPLFELMSRAHAVHRESFRSLHVQKCALLSIKTGGCPEDCAYCPQSAHYSTGVEKEPLLSVDQVRKKAQEAKAQGAARFCLGAAWREVKDGPAFDRVLEMIRVLKQEGLEACVTLGMLTFEQARRLKEAGLDAYNHNLDTSREFYPKIISTRTFEDRLKTIQNVRNAGITVCSGGILGMGESDEDRCALIAELASLDPQPESLPINLLVPMAGTPLEAASPVEPTVLVRVVAVARLLVPRARIRLSAGRLSLSEEAQLLLFFSGANSIFIGEKLLTSPNPQVSSDDRLLSLFS